MVELLDLTPEEEFIELEGEVKWMFAHGMFEPQPVAYQSVISRDGPKKSILANHSPAPPVNWDCVVWEEKDWRWWEHWPSKDNLNA